MALQPKPFDAAKHLATDEDQADLLADESASGDQTCIANALGVVARAKGMSQIAREALCKALSPSGTQSCRRCQAS